MSLTALLLIAVVGLMAYIRLAPAAPALWHIDLAGARPAAIAQASPDHVTTLPNGAYADLTTDQPQASLAQLDTIALATPRTRRLAGSVAEGRITWETRSKLIGFPDYTTAQITTTGVTLYARQRFGSQDMGVNAARLTAWISNR